MTVKWVTITPDWVALPSLRRFYWSVSADTMSPTKRSPFNEHHKTTTEHGNQSECSPAEIEAQQTNSGKDKN
jgi:hypothetical protein